MQFKHKRGGKSVSVLPHQHWNGEDWGILPLGIRFPHPLPKERERALGWMPRANIKFGTISVRKRNVEWRRQIGPVRKNEVFQDCFVHQTLPWKAKTKLDLEKWKKQTQKSQNHAMFCQRMLSSWKDKLSKDFVKIKSIETNYVNDLNCQQLFVKIKSKRTNYVYVYK